MHQFFQLCWEKSFSSVVESDFSHVCNHYPDSLMFSFSSWISALIDTWEVHESWVGWNAASCLFLTLNNKYKAQWMQVDRTYILSFLCCFLHCNCRKQCGGVSQGSRFRIQGPLPSAECEEDFGHSWTPVAWRSTHSPVFGGPGCSACSPRCRDQGREGEEASCLFLKWSEAVTVKSNGGCVPSCRWQTVYVWCPWIRQRLCL